jgi:hypothetical protein
MNLVEVTTTQVTFSEDYDGDLYEFTLARDSFNLLSCSHRLNKTTWEILSEGLIPLRLRKTLHEKQLLLRSINKR